MISLIGKYEVNLDFHNKYILIKQNNNIIYFTKFNDIISKFYRIANTLQELDRGPVGLALRLEACNDWTATVSPKLTGSGWIVDYGQRKIIAARCLNGSCILAERCVMPDIYYLDNKTYDGEVLAALTSLRLVEF